MTQLLDLDYAVSAITGSMTAWLRDDKVTGPETEKGKAIEDLAEKFYFENFAGKESLYLFMVAIGVLIGILTTNLKDVLRVPRVPDTEGPVN